VPTFIPFQDVAFQGFLQSSPSEKPIGEERRFINETNGIEYRQSN